MNTETPFTRALEAALSAPGRQTRVMRINAGSAVIVTPGGGRRRFSGAKAGTGDLVGYVAPEGWHLEVETKVDGARPRPAQLRRREALDLAGCIYVVVRWYESAGESLETACRRGVAEVDAAIEQRRAARGGSC